MSHKQQWLDPSAAWFDDASALAAKTAIETAGRSSDCGIVSQGASRLVHGGASERKEIPGQKFCLTKRTVDSILPFVSGR